MNSVQSGGAASAVLAAMALLLAVTADVANASEVPWPASTPVELAPGIIQFITPDIAGNVVGNSIAVLMDSDVLVFDTTLLGSTANGVLGELRSITPMPVRYVVNSHWHPDHTGGNEAFAASNPQLEIIASRETRRLMAENAFVYIKTLQFELTQTDREIRQDLKIGRTADGKPLSHAERAALQTQLAQEARFMEEFATTHVELPSLTFDGSLTLFHGGRELRLMMLPGHTAGDTALFLPAEKVLLAGDLLTYPVPFAANAHPSAWISSLEVLSHLDAQIIVPGHGPAFKDQRYLQLVLESLRSIQQQVQEALTRGLTLTETQKAIHLEAMRTQFTHDDPDLNASFDGNFGPVVRQFYDEATEGLELYQ